MKTKTLLLFFLLMFNIYSLAQQVTQREAVNAAINTMKYLGVKNSSTENIKDIYRVQNGQNTLLYEIAFKTGETILLSGNKSMKPVLGYILESNGETILNQYEQLPDGLKDFIKEYKEYANFCFNNTINSEENQRKWQELQTFNRNKTIRNVVGPLTTTKWGQNNAEICYRYDVTPSSTLRYITTNAYNRRIREYCEPCENYAPAGCTAIAIAQIMYYWKYPVFNSNNLPIYDWNNMGNSISYQHVNYIDEYGIEYTQQPYPPLTIIEGQYQQYQYRKRMDAIALLVYDCAIATETNFCYPWHNYCQSASGMIRAEEAFHSFNYSNADTKYRAFHLRRWKDMLRSELDNGRPICYFSWDGGIEIGQSFAHAYICDGYKDDDTFSFNWGWDGLYNGNFQVLEEGPEQIEVNNPIWHAAIFDIYPDNYQNPCDFTPYYQSLHSFYQQHPNETPYLITPFYLTEIKSVTKAQDPTGIYRTIPTQADAYYIAQEKVTLRDGFHAEYGSDFRAYISKYNDCDKNSKTEKEGKAKADDPLVETITPKTDNDLVIYPNPSTNTFTAQLLNTNTKIKQLTIHNILGHQIKNFNNPYDYTFNISSYPQGIYIIKVVTNENEIFYKKLIKN